LRAARSISSEPWAASQSRAIRSRLFQPIGEYSAEMWKPIALGSALVAVALHSPRSSICVLWCSAMGRPQPAQA
jgi:hypothetical protein